MPTQFLGHSPSRPYRPDRDEREDRFTEILAAVLEHDHCASLGEYVARGWLNLIVDGKAGGVPPERGRELLGVLDRATPRARVLTQQWISNGSRRIDLALVFPLPSSELVICVEAKIDAEPERDQLRDYVEWLDARPGPGLVVLAAPRARFGKFAPDQRRRDVAEIPWELTAGLLREYQPSGDAERLLVDELLYYMIEEDLVDPSKLEAGHVDSLVLYSDAWRALDRLLEIADEYLQKSWGAVLDGDANGTERWREYPARAELHSRALTDEFEGFTWDVLYDGGKWFPDMRPAVPTFTAGIYRREWMPERTDRVLNDCRFELFSRESGTWRGGRSDRIYRRATIDDAELNLLGYDTLDEQGTALGVWVEHAFEDLRAALSAKEVRQDYEERAVL